MYYVTIVYLILAIILVIYLVTGHRRAIKRGQDHAQRDIEDSR